MPTAPDFHIVRDSNPARVVVSGWDVREGAAVGVMAGACSLAAIPVVVGVWSAGALVPVGVLLGMFAAVALGVGFRVTIDPHDVRVVRHVLWIPFAWQRIPLDDAEAEVVQADEDAEPRGLLVRGRAIALGASENRWVFGNPRNAAALAQAIRAGIEAMRATRAESYRT